MGRKITKLRITEVSAVDRPANNLSRVTSMELVKRDDAPDLTPDERGRFKKFLLGLLKGEPELAHYVEQAEAVKAATVSKAAVLEALGDKSRLSEDQKQDLKHRLATGVCKVTGENGDEIKVFVKVAERDDVNP